MDIKEQYETLGRNAINILNESLKEDVTLVSSNHAFILDFSNWINILKEEPEVEILRNALKEYQMSIFSNIIGQYQQAFMSLRFFLERTLIAIYFSANEIELNLWKLGERDTYWNELMDKDCGIFSNKFCRAFFPELKDEIHHFEAITRKVYRECSEYVHANYAIFEKIPQTYSFSKNIYDEWNSKANVIKRIILFAFCLRYLKEVKKEDISSIEESLLEEFNFISPISEIITKIHHV